MQPDDVLSRWDLPPDLTLTPIDSGLINHTWELRDHGAPVAVLQRLNTAVFRASVHHDIDAVTTHLEFWELPTPILLPTRDGELCLEEDGEVWRVMTVVGSRTVSTLTAPHEAESAGALVGRFHAALDDLDWTFRHVRPGAHDTDAHMLTLQRALSDHPGHRLTGEVAALADGILSLWSALRPTLPADLPTRIIHGDLKISNVRFDGDEAVALIDLDTLAHGTLDVELGDAMRSWCGTAGEDAATATFDLDLFEAAMRGYAQGSRRVPPTAAEWASIVPGTQRIATELAARFAADALRESYFGWDPSRFPARGEHNLLRARGQLSLAREVARVREEAERRLTRARAAA